ncbi:MAG: hypothetical protein ACRCSV_03490, partial [Chlamydiales bacterium]
FYKVPVETLVNIPESKPTILSRISNIYENIKLFFLSSSKLDLDKIFKVEGSELLSSPLSPCLSFTIPENSINIIRVKKFNPDQILAQQREIFVKELERHTLNQMPKSNIVEEILLKNEVTNTRLRKFGTNLTPLTPLVPQKNSLEENFNTLSVDWTNADKNSLSMKEVAIKVKRELEEVAIKNKSKVEEAQISGRKELQEINEKKIEAKRKAQEAKLDTRGDAVVESLNNEKTFDQIPNLDQIIEKIEFNLKEFENIKVSL